MWAITNLCVGSEKNELRLGRVGAIQLVGTSLGYYIHHEGMVEVVLGALVYLAYHCVSNKLIIGGTVTVAVAVDNSLSSSNGLSGLGLWLEGGLFPLGSYYTDNFYLRAEIF